MGGTQVKRNEYRKDAKIAGWKDCRTAGRRDFGKPLPVNAQQQDEMLLRPPAEERYAADKCFYDADNQLHAADNRLYVTDNSIYVAENQIYPADNGLYAADKRL